MILCLHIGPRDLTQQPQLLCGLQEASGRGGFHCSDGVSGAVQCPPPHASALAFSAPLR